MDVIRPLTALTLADIDQVGGKAAHLGAMSRAGFPVPAGFVITVEAFTNHFGNVTDPLVKPPVPRLQPDFMAEVAEAIRAHLGSEPEFAVRSSSTSEDSAEASFAGQHSTYYFVPPTHIDQAIVDCWMSLWSDAAIEYRRYGASEIATNETIRMAVIVQKMVPATRSGVVFSRDPIDADNTDCVIEATWGLGASLVDGRVTPDQIRVSESGDLKSYVVNNKQYLVTANPSNPDGRRLDEVPKHQAMQPVLSDSEAERIGNIASQLDVLFEGPQDIEWAFAGDELNLLQSRPITTANPIGDGEPMVIFKPLIENFTEPLTPMSADLYASVLPRIGKIVKGRFYLELAMLRNLVPYQISDAELVDMALLRRAPQKLVPDRRKMTKLVIATALVGLMDGATWLRANWINESGLAKYRTRADSLRDDPRYDARKTLRRMFLGRHALEPLGLHMLILNITAGRYFVYLGMLQHIIRLYAPEFDNTQLNKTFHGRQQMHSVDLVHGIGHLASILADARSVDDQASTQIEAVIRGDAALLPAGHAFTIAVEQFIARFGHRCSREMELAAPRWSESVQPLLAMIADQQSSPDQAAREPDRYGEHLGAMDELHQHLSGWKRWLADHLINKVAKYSALRENTRHYHIMGFAATRYKLLEVEQQLLFTDRLKVPGDIFFLRHDEAVQLADETMTPQDAHQLIRRRRREYARSSRLPVEETLHIPDVVGPTHAASNTADNDTSNPGSMTLQGQCACPGIAEGIARVAHSLQEATALEAGEILVAPYTDPSWTPLFPRAAGIVVGVGSYLSHAGTVAREMHVPCVVDVKNCTQLIKSGQHLRLDASTGTVEVLT